MVPIQRKSNTHCKQHQIGRCSRGTETDHENRFNNGTAEVFKEIENDTKEFRNSESTSSND